MAISLAAETQPPAFKLYLCIAVTVFVGAIHLLVYIVPCIHIHRSILPCSVFDCIVFTTFGHEKGIQPLNWKDVPALAVLGFFSVTLHHLLINTGQQYVTAVASSILSQSIPLFTFIISVLVFKEKSVLNSGYVFYWDLAAPC